MRGGSTAPQHYTGSTLTRRMWRPLSLSLPIAPFTHALSGVGGWADEIVSFGFIIAIIAVLMVMSRLGKRKRLREKERDQK